MKETRRLFRSRKTKVIGGVCGGFADYFNIDVVFIRAIFVIALLGFGTGLLAYIILWIMIPLEYESIFGERSRIYE